MDEADRGVDQQHDGDHDGVLEIPDHSGQQGSAHQDEDEHAAELVEEARPSRSADPIDELVGAVRLATPQDLGVLEATNRVEGKVLQDLAGRAQVRILCRRTLRLADVGAALGRVNAHRELCSSVEARILIREVNLIERKTGREPIRPAPQEDSELTARAPR